MRDCKYCYYNTVLNCCSKNHDVVCDEYDENHLAKKYENTRFKLKWVSHPCNDYLIMEDSLHDFSDWTFECLEDGEELTDYLNKKELEIQELDDMYCDSILELIEKYNVKGYNPENIKIIEVLVELLVEVGKEHLLEDMWDYEEMEENKWLPLKNMN